MQTGILLGDAEPLSLSGKWEAYSRMQCPAGVRVAGPAERLSGQRFNFLI